MDQDNQIYFKKDAYNVFENQDITRLYVETDHFFVAPGVKATLTDTTIKVANAAVVLGELTLIRSEIQAAKKYIPFKGKWRKLMKLTNLTPQQTDSLKGTLTAMKSPILSGSAKH